MTWDTSKPVAGMNNDVKLIITKIYLQISYNDKFITNFFQQKLSTKRNKYFLRDKHNQIMGRSKHSTTQMV